MVHRSCASKELEFNKPYLDRRVYHTCFRRQPTWNSTSKADPLSSGGDGGTRQSEGHRAERKYFSPKYVCVEICWEEDVGWQAASCKNQPPQTNPFSLQSPFCFVGLGLCFPGLGHHTAEAHGIWQSHKWNGNSADGDSKPLSRSSVGCIQSRHLWKHCANALLSRPGYLHVLQNCP